MAEEYLNLVYYAKVVNKYKWLIFGATFISAMVYAAKPEEREYIYETSLTAIVPGMRMSADRISIGGITLGSQTQFSGGSFSIDLINGLMESRKMRADIIKKFNLDKIPGFYFKTNASGLSFGIKITVEGSDPKLIVDIANFCIEELNILNDTLELTSDKFIVKILDPPLEGTLKSRASRRTNKIILVAMSTFLVTILFSFGFEGVMGMYKKEKASLA